MGVVNVVVPMAGAGSRLEGYSELPKPMILVKGHTILEHSLNSLDLNREHKFTFVVRDTHEEEFGVSEYIDKIMPYLGSHEIVITGETEGQACSVAKAIEGKKDHPFVVLNADNYIDMDTIWFYEEIAKCNTGVVTVFPEPARTGKWSYAELGVGDTVLRLKEKDPFTDTAVAGLFYFASSKKFLETLEFMQHPNYGHGEEYFISPLIQVMAWRYKVYFKYFYIDKMWSLGTSEEIQEFIDNV